jgi:pimeloyl-ACP methyl ester carboxylesterase
MWPNFEAAFKKYFPRASFVVEEKWFSPWRGEDMREFADSLRRKHDDGDEALLIGHSMGGVIACAIAPRFKKSRIRGVITICSPHQLFGGIFPRMLGVEKRIPAPVISFGGVFDYLGPWGAQYGQARAHEALLADHYFALLYSQKPAERIAEAAHTTLFAQA